MANSIKSKFKALANAWQKATEAASSGGFDNVEDGFYRCQLTKGTVKESSNGNLQTVLVFTVLEGDKEGETITKYCRMEDEDSLTYLAKDLAVMNMVVDDLDELQEALNMLVASDTVVRLQVKTKGDFTNKYINKLLSQGDIAGSEDEDEEEEEQKPAPKKTTTKKVVEPEPEEEEEEEEEEEKPVAKKKLSGKVEIPNKLKTSAKKVVEPEPEEEDEEEEDEDEEGDDELKIGMEVQFVHNGTEKQGKITAVDNENETAVVKVGIKSIEISFEDIQGVII